MAVPNRGYGGDRQEADEAWLESLCRAIPFPVVERVLLDPSERALADQDFEGTVMFLDVAGFTNLCERLASTGPMGLSTLSRILGDLFARLLDRAIHPYQGHVIQFGGDSITTIFRGRNHERRAVMAGLHCQAVMRADDTVFAQQGENLTMRVGIASGPVRLTMQGDVHRRLMTCGGTTAHRAVTIESQTPNGDVGVDGAIATALGTDLTSEPNGQWLLAKRLRQPPKSDPVRVNDDLLATRVSEKIALLQPFLPAALNSRMADMPSGWRLKGELRHAVILFSEVWGFDEIGGVAHVRTAVAGAARSILNVFEKYGGTVAKIDLASVGHRVLVLFGLHNPRENDVERAVLAGLEVNDFFRQWNRDTGFGAGYKTGIHAGTVYFGPIGADSMHDITVVGDAVNVAARVAHAAEPFELLVSGQVLQTVPGDFEHDDRGAVQVKGKTSGVQMHAITAPKRTVAEFVRPAEAVAYVAGRETERASLTSIADRCLGGDVALVGINGVAGAGKTVMLGPLHQHWLDSGGTVALVRCRFATRTTPLEPVAQMLENLLGVSESQSDVERLSRIDGGLKKLGLRREAPELRDFMRSRSEGRDDAGATLMELDTWRAVVASIMEIIDKRCQQQPMLYVLEDVHFADTLTMSLAQALSTIPKNRRLMVVATYRPYASVLDFRRTCQHELVLRHLKLQAATDLAAHEAQVSAVDPELAVFLWQLTSGMPGHLIEALRFLEDNDMVVRTGDRLNVREAGIAALENDVPPTLAKLAQARIDSLNPVAKFVLRTASAIGRRFSHDLLRAALTADISHSDLANTFESLANYKVLVPNGDGYMFHDATIRAAAYRGIPEAERREVHHRIADALESLPHRDPMRAPESIARHRRQAHQPEDAIGWYRRAITAAVSSGLHREAADLVESWLELSEPLHRAGTVKEVEILEMRVLQVIAVARAGEPARAVQLGEGLGEFAAHWHDSPYYLSARYWVGHGLLHLGRPAEARDVLLQVFESTISRKVRADAAWLLARSYEHDMNYALAQEWLGRAEGLIKPTDARRLGRLAIIRANLLATAGRLSEAEAIYREVKGTISSRDHLPLAASAITGLGYSRMLHGDPKGASSNFEEALTIHRALGDWSEEANDLVNLGQSLLWADQFDQAGDALRRALALSTDLGYTMCSAEAQLHLGMVTANDGELPRGRSMTGKAMAELERGGLPDAVAAGCLHLLTIATREALPHEIETALQLCETHVATLAKFPLFHERAKRLAERVASRLPGRASEFSARLASEYAKSEG